ncbi:MAG: AarF/UbiB family protein [Catonella sp.]|nr:AarF/UbiB family protein [Catonella sp.]MDY6356375.1 AarF/UbiB family protein [Catonella sp.]
MEEAKEKNTRFREIREVLKKHHITRGITPVKLREILEDLGPTYIKLGQIMSLHSDILPEAYCEELARLNSDVSPMPFSDVLDVLNDSFPGEITEYFDKIDEKPLGSASIAQVHRAKLKDGSDVVIKVQRKGIKRIMQQDIAMLHNLVRFMPPVTPIKNVVDLDMVIDEMWSVAREEMDFSHEADNIEEFAKNNRDINYIYVPKLYRDYTTNTVLVMEYIDGVAIDDKDSLTRMGYDLNEIGIKFVNNFIKQVMDDGFFHADPHPGNVKIRGGKIVFLDMGMMGRLTEKDREIMVRGVNGIAIHDVNMVMNAVTDLGDFNGKPNRSRLYSDLKEFLSEYGSASMGSINVADAMMDLMDIMKTNHIRLPHGMTMLCRGLSHMQGDLAEIAPGISMMEIASTRITEDRLKTLNLRASSEKAARVLYRNMSKGAEIPGLTADIMKEYLDGESRLNITLYSSEGLSNMVNYAVRNLVIGMCLAALLVASAIISTTNMEPRIMGIPFPGFIGFAFAFFATIFLILRYVIQRLRRKKK